LGYPGAKYVIADPSSDRGDFQTTPTTAIFALELHIGKALPFVVPRVPQNVHGNALGVANHPVDNRRQIRAAPGSARVAMVEPWGHRAPMLPWGFLAELGHSRTGDVEAEIYSHSRAGRILILDLSVGQIYVRKALSEPIARYIFETSTTRFQGGHEPPNIVMYVEESHNLIGKDADLHETWPRIACSGPQLWDTALRVHAAAGSGASCAALIAAGVW
jgi:hypothetical protein